MNSQIDATMEICTGRGQTSSMCSRCASRGADVDSAALLGWRCGISIARCNMNESSTTIYRVTAGTGDSQVAICFCLENGRTSSGCANAGNGGFTDATVGLGGKDERQLCHRHLIPGRWTFLGKRPLITIDWTSPRPRRNYTSQGSK